MCSLYRLKELNTVFFKFVSSNLNCIASIVCTTSYNLFCFVCCFAEISNLLVVTKDRALAQQTPMQESQLSFDRIHKEEIDQVHLVIVMPLTSVPYIITRQFQL